MHYEKAYKEALERARKIENGEPIDVPDGTHIPVAIFPELAESEDEKIIKGIISNLDNMIAYIEDYECSPKVKESAINDIKKQKTWLEKQGEQKLYVNDNAKEMFIRALERVEEQNNKGYKLTDCDKNSWWEDFKAYTSCIIEQKPIEWSEEDEYVYNEILKRVADKKIYEHDLEYIYKWLKSLKPQSHWKPSDEQMEALDFAKAYLCDIKMRGAAEELYNDLKKLKEE